MAKIEKYQKYFSKEFLMGPNGVRLLDEMLENHPIAPNSKIMDLGCGKGLTSLFLAQEAKANVFAVDLWISATENYRQFSKWGIENNVIPIHADANNLPFANEYFDAVVSIDSFHYFSTQPDFFYEKILPLIKKDGVALIAMPGLKEEIHGNEPPLVREWVDSEEGEYDLFHSLEWWKSFIGQNDGFEIVKAFELNSYLQSWDDWFASGHEFAMRDSEYFKLGIDRYLAMIGFIIRKNR